MEQVNKEYENELNLHDLWNVIVKRRIIIIGLFLIFVIVATIYSLLAPKIYRGEGVLVVQPASLMSVKEVIDFVGQIDGDKINSFAPKMRDSITDVKFSLNKDTKDKISVIIESKDKNTIQPMMSQLVEYINGFDFIKKNVKEEQDRLKQRAVELDVIIAASAGLLKDYSHMLKAGKLVPLGFNPLDLNKKITDIKLEKFQVAQQIQRLKGGIELATQVYVKDRHVKPAKRRNVVIAGMSGLFMGIILAFFIEYFMEYIEKNKKIT